MKNIFTEKRAEAVRRYTELHERLSNLKKEYNYAEIKASSKPFRILEQTALIDRLRLSNAINKGRYVGKFSNYGEFASEVRTFDLFSHEAAECTEIAAELLEIKRATDERNSFVEANRMYLPDIEIEKELTPLMEVAKNYLDRVPLFGRYINVNYRISLVRQAFIDLPTSSIEKGIARGVIKESQFRALDREVLVSDEDERKRYAMNYNFAEATFAMQSGRAAGKAAEVKDEAAFSRDVVPEAKEQIDTSVAPTAQRTPTAPAAQIEKHEEQAAINPVAEHDVHPAPPRAVSEQNFEKSGIKTNVVGTQSPARDNSSRKESLATLKALMSTGYSPKARLEFYDFEGDPAAAVIWDDDREGRPRELGNLAAVETRQIVDSYGGNPIAVDIERVTGGKRSGLYGCELTLYPGIGDVIVPTKKNNDIQPTLP